MLINNIGQLAQPAANGTLFLVPNPMVEMVEKARRVKPAREKERKVVDLYPRKLRIESGLPKKHYDRVA